MNPTQQQERKACRIAWFAFWCFAFACVMAIRGCATADHAEAFRLEQAARYHAMVTREYLHDEYDNILETQPNIIK
jgi:hypothetical protein